MGLRSRQTHQDTHFRSQVHRCHPSSSCMLALPRVLSRSRRRLRTISQPSAGVLSPSEALAVRQRAQRFRTTQILIKACRQPLHLAAISTRSSTSVHRRKRLQAGTCSVTAGLGVWHSTKSPLQQQLHADQHLPCLCHR